jgi:signal transduction histidine kinase
VAVLLLFAFASGFLVEQHIDRERQRNESAAAERLEAWGDLFQRSLPGADAASRNPGGGPARVVAAAALSARARRCERPAHRRFGVFRAADGRGAIKPYPVKFDDGRTLWTFRPGQLRQGARRASARRPAAATAAVAALPGNFPRGAGLAIVLVVLFIAIAAGAYPVVRRLTRRLEALKRGVEQFGAGQLSHRVEVSGSDEVAAVASSFNVAAQRVEALVQSHRSLLANASHELRSPLARMKMAVSMLDGAAPEQRAKLKAEINRNVAELDALVEEVLLASRLDVAQDPLLRDRVDLVAVAAEEAARVDATVDAPAGLAIDRRRAAAAPRSAQPARERASLRWRRDHGDAAAADEERRRHHDPGLRPRRRRAGGDARTDLRAVLPPAGPRRAGGRGRPRPVAGQADRRAPRRQRALRVRATVAAPASELRCRRV